MIDVHSVHLYLGGTGEIFSFKYAKRPRMSIWEENTANVRKILNEIRQVIYRQKEKTLGLNAPPIRLIQTNHLFVIQLFCLWVPHPLTEDQKTRRVKGCQKIKDDLIMLTTSRQVMRHSYSTTKC